MRTFLLYALPRLALVGVVMAVALEFRGHVPTAEVPTWHSGFAVGALAAGAIMLGLDLIQDWDGGWRRNGKT
jgi:hypothetical protein